MLDPSYPWFRSPYLGERAQLRLFCFPCAGGTAHIYRDWQQYLPPTIEVLPAQLPGRGPRLREPSFVSLPDLVTALTTAITPLLDRPFAFFGHSMGAAIAFELARRVRKGLACEPEVLCVSGRRAPQVPSDKPPSYNLPNDEFIAELQRMDGTPREVLEHTELMELFAPVLRADFQLIQTYHYEAGAPLACPINAYGGLEDNEVPRELLSMWRSQTTSRFALYMLPGDHFFLRSSQTLLLEMLAQQLQEALAGGRINTENRTKL
jgi:medium-chain acyl-[acyl-carrier-protein] hydrolase